MRVVLRLCFVSIVLFLIVSFTPEIFAQPAKDKAPDQPPPTSPEGAKATPAAPANRPAAAEYQRITEDWKTVLKDLRKLKVQYQTAALADQAKIQTEWTDLVEKGNQTVVALEAAGIKAYAEAPNE